MKKMLFLIAVLCLTRAGTVMADTDLTTYSNVIYVAPATIDPCVDGSEATLSICMDNTVQIRGFQFDLYLPEGMTAIKSSKGKYAVSLNKARLAEDDEHTLTVAVQGDGAIRFLCGSQYDETFTGTSGEIATIKVNMAGMKAGEYPITLKAVKLTESDISKFYEVPEVVTTFTVSSSGSPEGAGTDYTAYSNVIYVAPATIDLGDQVSETTLSVCMNNTAQIRGFQFDMYLPEGMTAVKTSKGKFAVSLNKARLAEDDEHTLTVAEQGDGAIRFLCGSQYDETFTGTSGEIATIKVNIAGLKAGEYPVTLRAVKLSETDISKHYDVTEIVTMFTVADIATDKTELNNAISEAEEYYDTIKESNPDVAATLQAAINAAKKVQDNTDATQQEIDTATTNLKEAIEEAKAFVDGINTVKNADNMNGNRYDLSGRRVAQPAKKGIHIINGKTVVIK